MNKELKVVVEGGFESFDLDDKFEMLNVDGIKYGHLHFENGGIYPVHPISKKKGHLYIVSHKTELGFLISKNEYKHLKKLKRKNKYFTLMSNRCIDLTSKYRVIDPENIIYGSLNFKKDGIYSIDVKRTKLSGCLYLIGDKGTSLIILSSEFSNIERVES